MYLAVNLLQALHVDQKSLCNTYKSVTSECLLLVAPVQEPLHGRNRVTRAALRVLGLLCNYGLFIILFNQVAFSNSRVNYEVRLKDAPALPWPP